MTSKLWDRLAHCNHAVAKVPVLNVDISAAALLIHLDAASLRSVLGLTASVLHFFQYRDYRRLRPQASLPALLHAPHPREVPPSFPQGLKCTFCQAAAFTNDEVCHLLAYCDVC